MIPSFPWWVFESHLISIPLPALYWLWVPGIHWSVVISKTIDISLQNTNNNSPFYNCLSVFPPGDRDCYAVILPTCRPHWGRCRPAEPSPPSERWCSRGTGPGLSWWWWRPSVRTSGGTGRNCPHDPDWSQPLPSRGKLKHGEIKTGEKLVLFIQPCRPSLSNTLVIFGNIWSFQKFKLIETKSSIINDKARYLFSELNKAIYNESRLTWDTS